MSEITFSMRGKAAIPETQARALKRLLKCLGARRVSVSDDGAAVHAKFKSPEALHRAQRNGLEPLQVLFQNQNLQYSEYSQYSQPEDPTMTKSTLTTRARYVA